MNASLPEVPIWLDEGLAQYYERRDHLAPRQLQSLKVGKGFSRRPNLRELESRRRMQEMSADDYAEAWAWTHFLLQGSPETRAVFSAFVNDLGQGKAAPLSGRLPLQAQRQMRRHFELLRTTAEKP